MTSWKILLTLGIHLFPLISAEYKDSESLCASQQTCSSCLQTPRCVWCSSTESNERSSHVLVRCITREKYRRDRDLWCPLSNVIDNENSFIIDKDRPLSSMKGTDPVQIRPQKVHLRLRRGEEYRMTLSYSQAEDYPVDLYYLMDLSRSMEEYRDRLSKTGLKIADAMRKLTSNFRLGFGSFVDKVVLPMTNTQEGKRDVPCTTIRNGITVPCASPYGYKNQMPLTNDIHSFKSRVQEAPLSGNLDTPEGGLDAMMQAIVCTKEIGWRQNARHLIVFSTDAVSHIAGDGRLAGIIEPNDCLCHLDETGFYTYSLLQDYPSISQINKMAHEHNVNIIFAITKSVSTNYELLSRSIGGSSTGIIDKDSRNVVALISGEYKKLVQSVALTDDAPKMIDVKYFSRCLETNGKLKERRECGGLRVGNVVHFEVVLKAVECPADAREWQQTMQIKPRGLNESLVIDLNIVCDCPCERPGNPGYKAGSADCKGNGTLTCGVCACNQGYYGKHCECKGNDVGTDSEAAMIECKPNNETTEICSGRGVCKCAMCECATRPNPQEIYYGKYCECDNFYCKRSGGLVCGGRGKCECGTCNCLAGWGGETCDCEQTNSTCMPSNGGAAEICSGRGDCVCGNCHCHEKDNIRYSGRYCEECPTCPGQWCDELKDCVECTAYNTGRYAENGKCDTCPHQIDIVDVVEEDSVKDLDTGARVCRTPGDAGCTFTFKYHQHRDGTGGDIKIFNILAQKERTCPKPINVFGVAVGLVASTVFLGFLMLLIWKILTTIYDKREFAKFERERALAKWNRGDNPLYKQATSTFVNPTFHESTKD
ncbi:integrin beta-PS [Lasioglossum baleicum]|uniref:integrin beta-PS n=1 Tax=Lasioglossum baleicum TaxID=434251 RepID=UPI003FCD6119